MDAEGLLRAAENLYDEETDKIGQAVREKLLIPFCDKYKMKFDAGMGCWSIENDFINIYGVQATYWEVPKEALKAVKEDAEYEALIFKAQAFRALPETEELLKILDARTMRGASIGCNIASYTPGGSMGKPKCACQGTGLIPPTAELKDGGHQVYCPTHKCKRDWPQLQADGSVEYKELRADNRGLK